MRKEFKLTKEQLDYMMEASKPTRYLVIGKTEPTSPQENTNRAWEVIANELGFDTMSVKPVHGKGAEFFTADIK